ncbi:hypothetical protein Taro_043431 [Colocasia esculenta]|uniref:HMA domain-containing protein n=1 Tax=Colocasia esculenta TaxID=4460 RepID=A0A843WS38_COLES|nr:hypothetical protein [Colocasia esculenta]
MRTRKMHGFMCQSQASTAVCIPGDARSVVVPRRPDRTLVDHARVVDLKYSRLGDGRRPAAPGEKRLQVITLPVSTACGSEKRMQLMAVPTRAKAATPPPPPKSRAVTAVPNLDKVRPRGAQPSLPASDDHGFQVVVMRVSIHCQGCAGKVKKHLSKMEGVTSFSIDLEAKRVTVMGRVSPADVLDSISKVKKAEFWPSASSAMANNLKPEPAALSHPQLVLPSVTA